MKRKLLIFAVITFVLVSYMPLIKCEQDALAKEKICKLYGECQTDYYNSVTGLIGMWGKWDTYCPASRINSVIVLAMAALILVISFSLAHIIDMLYSKYRDI